MSRRRSTWIKCVNMTEKQYESGETKFVDYGITSLGNDILSSQGGNALRMLGPVGESYRLLITNEILKYESKLAES